MNDPEIFLPLHVADVESAGLTVPSEVRRGLDLLDALGKAGRSADTTLDKLHADARAGKLAPSTVAHRVTEAATARTVTEASKPIARELARTVAGSALNTLRLALDELLAEYRPTWDDAAQTVADSVAAGINPDTTAADALAAGPDTLALYGRLDQALAQLDAARGLVNGLNGNPSGAERYVSADSPAARQIHRTGGFDHQTETALERAQPHVGGKGWMRLTAAGWTLHLNTSGEARTVVQAATEAVAAASKPARFE